MIIEKTINGRQIYFEAGRHFETGERIKGDYDGYALSHKSDGFRSFIFFKSKSYFSTDQSWKNIGCMEYDYETDVITYRKSTYNRDRHEHHIDNCIGLCWDVVSNLCPKDRIIIHEPLASGDNYHIISVNKLLKNQNFKHYKQQGYEKQIFIPFEEFKTVSKKRKKSAKRSKKFKISIRREDEHF